MVSKRARKRKKKFRSCVIQTEVVAPSHVSFLACSQKVKFIEKASNENVLAETEFWKLALDWKEIQELNKQEDFFGQHLVALVWSLSFFSCYFSPALLKNKASNFITARNSGLHDSLSIKRV